MQLFTINRRSGYIASFAAGFLIVGALSAVTIPQSATARWERPTGQPTPACKLPAGSCFRFLTGTPTQQEIDYYLNQGYSVVHSDSAGGDVYYTPPAFAGAMVQDIGL